MLILRLLRESFNFAINSLILNKLRTFLSLMGISIGVFAIISVFTVIDALESNIRESIESLGDDIVYIQKWPWSMGGDYAWWEYMKRPQAKLEEAEELLKRSTKIEAASYIIGFNRTVSYNTNYAENISIEAATHDYELVRNFEIARGRYFTPFESVTGKNAVILGYELASQLFENTDPLGKTLKIAGRKVFVIGVLAKQGEDFFSFTMDNNVIMPINFARNIVDIKSDNVGPSIWVKPYEHISAQEIMDELKSRMRAIRRIKPLEKDNFALNRTSIISQGFEQLFAVIDVVGLIIGGFSILVGGFGIANIMFVSVKEQTRIIGIQKALGAKNSFILQQFLYEATILSLMGGVLGLLAVLLLITIAGMVTDMSFSLSLGNIIFGLSMSLIIGVISGFAPAYKASRLNPVDAISYQ